MDLEIGFFQDVSRHHHTSAMILWEKKIMKSLLRKCFGRTQLKV